MAEHASEADTEAEDRTGTARGAGRVRAAHGRPTRLLLGVAAIVPLLLAAGALAVAPDR